MNSTVFNAKNKYIIIAAVIILLIPAILAVYFSTNTDSGVASGKVAGINVVSPAGTSQQLTSEEDFGLYTNAVENARLIDANFRDLSAEIPYTVSFTETDGTVKEYSFYMTNHADGCIYTDSQQNYYLLSETDAAKLLAKTEFSAVNTYAVVPAAIVLNGNSNATLTPTGGVWNYHEADGSFSAKQVNAASVPEEIKINANFAGTLSFDTAVQPDKVSVTLSKDGIVKHEGAFENMLNENVMAANDTYYDIVINAEWQQKDGVDYFGNVTYTAKLLYDVSPSYSIIFRGVVSKGDFTIIKIQNFNDGDKLFAQSAYPVPTELKVFKSNAGYSYAFLPAEYATNSAAGKYNLTLSLEDGSSQTLSFTVNEGRAPTTAAKTQDMIVADQKLQSCFSADAFTEFNNIVAEKTAATGETPLWDGKFVYPDKDNKGTVGTGMAQFGTLRNVGGLYQYSYVHNGIDIALGHGAEVRAANNGKVVFAGVLTLTGNTVIIDHGCSVLSYYGHLDSLNVVEGDTVTKSAVIGKAGMSGFAVMDDGAACKTASQVHFATSIEGVFVNPYYLWKVGVNFND